MSKNNYEFGFEFGFSNDSASTNAGSNGNPYCKMNVKTDDPGLAKMIVFGVLGVATIATTAYILKDNSTNSNEIVGGVVRNLIK